MTTKEYLGESFLRKSKKTPPDFALMGAFKMGDQAWRFLEKEEADILITDIKMPGMFGLELALYRLAQAAGREKIQRAGEAVHRPPRHAAKLLRTGI